MVVATVSKDSEVGIPRELRGTFVPFARLLVVVITRVGHVEYCDRSATFKDDAMRCNDVCSDGRHDAHEFGQCAYRDLPKP